MPLPVIDFGLWLGPDFRSRFVRGPFSEQNETENVQQQQQQDNDREEMKRVNNSPVDACNEKKAPAESHRHHHQPESNDASNASTLLRTARKSGNNIHTGEHQGDSETLTPSPCLRQPRASIEDEMTLEELETLVNGQKSPSDSNAMQELSQSSSFASLTASVSMDAEAVSVPKKSVSRAAQEDFQGGQHAEANAAKPITGKRKRAVDKSVPTVARDIASNTLNRCVPLVHIPSEFSVTQESADNVEVPSFDSLVNFPQQWVKTAAGNRKCCVMCGNLRVVKKKAEVVEGATPYISLYKKRDVCSSCEAASWVSVDGDIQIKLCQQCRNFCRLCDFVPKVVRKNRQGFLNSCVGCRNRITDCIKARKAKKAQSFEKKGTEGDSTGVSLAQAEDASSADDSIVPNPPKRGRANECQAGYR